MFKFLLFQFFISSIFAFKQMPLHTCHFNFMVPKICEMTNLNYDKQNYDFYIAVADMANMLNIVQVINSTLPKLGIYGFCGAPHHLIGYSMVYGLNITNAQVEEIHGDAFKGCANLNSIVLRDNKIEKIAEGLFNRNKKLEIIDLTNNFIKELPEETFQQMKKLKELHLGNNRLKMFAPDLVEDASNLGTLRLYSNDLFDLNVKKIAEYCSSLKNISFNDNQIRCEKSKEISNFLDRKNISRNFEENKRERNVKTSFVENNERCLDDISWAASHYIYIYNKIMEDH